MIRKRIAAEGAGEGEQESAPSLTAEADAAAVLEHVADGRGDAVTSYFNLLASEDEDIGAQIELARRVGSVVAQAADRPQTSTIVALCRELRALPPQQHGERAAALARLEAELAKPDNVLWSQLEGEDDEFFGRIAYAFDRANNFPG